MKTELSGDGLTIEVDHSRCSGMGYCKDSLPALFVVQEQRAWLQEGYDLATADHEELEEVAAACPWFAITVEET